MAEKHIDLGLTALDELFMTEEGRQENRLPRIRQIPLDMIDDMPDHPFKVRRDDDMELLIESVREHGVITPIIVRQKEDGRYETAAGHRRRMASKINGLTTIPAEVREMTRDEAIIIMCESNLQRTKILPSEKAFSYRMRLEAMKRQAGRRPMENGVPVGHHLSGKSRELVAAESPDSNTQIQRYIRLTYLIPELLKMVDEENIAFRPAVELSYLAEQEQRDLVETIGYEDATPSQSQAIKMREMSKAGTLTNVDCNRESKVLAEERHIVAQGQLTSRNAEGLLGIFALKSVKVLLCKDRTGFIEAHHHEGGHSIANAEYRTAASLAVELYHKGLLKHLHGVYLKHKYPPKI